MNFIFLQITHSIFFILKNHILFLHCVDSNLHQNSYWYARFHFRPFTLNSRLQIKISFRRVLMIDFPQIFIIAIELDGVIHEFLRISGIYDTILDFIFQFRKLIFYVLLIKKSEIRIIPFFIYGPGTFYIKDILFSITFTISNFNEVLITIAQRRRICGHFLIQKNKILKNRINSEISIIFLYWKIKYQNYKVKILNLLNKCVPYLSECLMRCLNYFMREH